MTPGKGRGHVLKNRDQHFRAHELRCDECDGLTVVALVNEDGKPLR